MCEDFSGEITRFVYLKFTCVGTDINEANLYGGEVCENLGARAGARGVPT